MDITKREDRMSQKTSASKPTSNNSTPHLATEGNWKEKYYVNFYTLRKELMSPRIAEELAKEVVKWASEDKKGFKISQFYLSRGIAASTFYFLINKHPVLKNAVECAKELIGNRREIGALTNKLNPNMVMSQMSKYDKSWWTLEQRRADLRAKSQQKVDPDVKYAIVVEDFSKDGDKTNNLPEEE